MHHLPSRYIPCDGRLTATAYFNPRSPHGERPFDDQIQWTKDNISIPAPRMGSDAFALGFERFKKISIHAPRMGSDYIASPFVGVKAISIHAPRMGSDHRTVTH